MMDGADRGQTRPGDPPPGVPFSRGLFPILLQFVATSGPARRGR